MKLGKTKDRRTKFQLHMWVKKEEFSSKNQPKMASTYEKRKNAGLNSIRGSENLQQGGKFWADRTGSIIFKMAAKG